ncbi:hypothetical protein GW17_00039873 [Ensete ventricosum]|nr:hypothetical protein GW17_00039873 [Ensete ventricosum]
MAHFCFVLKWRNPTENLTFANEVKLKGKNMTMETDPELIFLDQIELRGHGLAGEGGEELEEPRDELGGQLLRLHALPLHRRYDPLVRSLDRRTEEEMERKVRHHRLVLRLVEPLAELVQLLDLGGVGGGIGGHGARRGERRLFLRRGWVEYWISEAEEDEELRGVAGREGVHSSLWGLETGGGGVCATTQASDDGIKLFDRVAVSKPSRIRR